MLLTGCGQDKDRPVGKPRIEGYWAGKVDVEGSLIAPVGDGRSAFFSSSVANHIQLATLGEAPREFELPLASGTWGEPLGLAAGDRQHVFLYLDNSPGLFVLDSDGTLLNGGYPVLADRTFPIERNGLRDEPDAIFPAGDGIHVWVKPTGPGLYLLNSRGRILNGGRPLLPDTEISAPLGVYPAGDGEHAWIQAKDGALYLVSTNGQVLNGSRPLLPDIKIEMSFDARPPRRSELAYRVPLGMYTVTRVSGIQPAGDGRHLWINPENSPGLYLADTSGRMLNHGKPLLPRIDVESIHPLAKGLVWVRKRNTPDEKDGALYLLGTDGRVRNRGAPLIQGLGVQSTLHPAGDREHAWLSLERELEDGLPVYSLFLVNPQGRILNRKAPAVESLDTDYYRFRILDAGDSQQSWFVEESAGIQVLNPRGERLVTKALLAPDLLAGWMTLDNSGVTWIEEDPEHVSGEPLRCMVAGTARHLKARLEFGGEALSSEGGGHALLDIDPTEDGREIEVTLDWPGKGLAPRASVNVEIRGDDSRVAWASANLAKETPTRATLTWEKGRTWKPDYPYQVALYYSDDLGSELKVVWPEARFALPWIERPTNRTWVVFAGILALVGIALWIGRSVPAVSRWFPSLWLLATTAAGNLPAIAGYLRIEGNLLVVLLASTLVILVSVGLASPRAFRSLAQAEPFRWLSPFALTLPWFRRRFYAEYLAELRRQLRDEREKANYESYVELPATSVESGLAERRSLLRPAEEISALLTRSDSEEHTNVLISSPGGRGKSALLREITERAALQFQRSRRAPLPVLCQPIDTGLVEIVQRALGRYVISREALVAELEAGRLLLVLDGLSESSLNPSTLEDFVKSEAGSRTPLLMATRPHESYESAVRASRAWILLEPQRLDEETLVLFEKAYAGADKSRTGQPLRRLSESQKAVCRSLDGTYLPILVRLALLSGLEEAESLVDLYEAAFRRLLRSSDRSVSLELLGETAGLCVTTYWETGVRSLAYASAPAGRHELLQKLLGAGILVPLDKTLSPLGNEPREVKFFHDSMQSYLTALGLFQREDWGCLQRAAGDPLFVNATFDLSAGGGSEIFLMCLHVFRPVERLRGVLYAQLRRWAEEYGGDLTSNQIWRSLPKETQERIERISPTAARQDSASTILLQAIELCRESDAAKHTVEHLATVYARLAPMIYRFAPASPALTK